MNTMLAVNGTVDFLPMKTVVQRVGLSKSEIYRQIAAGTFPAARGYQDNLRKRFWLSSDIAAWQKAQLGDDFDALL